MKKVIILLFAIAILSFRTEKATERVYTFKFNQGELIDIRTKIVQVQNYIDQTNLPHNEVKLVQAKLDSIWLKIYSQLPDSTKAGK